MNEGKKLIGYAVRLGRLYIVDWSRDWGSSDGIRGTSTLATNDIKIFPTYTTAEELAQDVAGEVVKIYWEDEENEN